jgi:hypothetical protein
MTSYVHCIISKDSYGVAHQMIRCTIGRLGMKVQCASPCTTPTCIVIMTNAASNVAVGFPAIPKLLVTIVIMSISFLIRPQVGGCVSHVCLTGGRLLGRPLVSGGISLSSSLSLGESSSLSLLIFGTRGSTRLGKPHGTHTGCSAGKTNLPFTPHSQTMGDDMLSGLTSMCKGIDIMIC